jgi:hypothetical protein
MILLQDRTFSRQQNQLGVAYNAHVTEHSGSVFLIGLRHAMSSFSVRLQLSNRWTLLEILLLRSVRTCGSTELRTHSPTLFFTEVLPHANHPRQHKTLALNQVCRRVTLSVARAAMHSESSN